MRVSSIAARSRPSGPRRLRISICFCSASLAVSLMVFRFLKILDIVEPTFTTLICQGDQMRPPFGPLQRKTPSRHRGRERVPGIRPLGGGIDRCPVNFGKHNAILLHSSPSIKSIAAAFFLDDVQRGNQRGKILFDRFPYCAQFHSPVFMYGKVPLMSPINRQGMFGCFSVISSGTLRAASPITMKLRMTASTVFVSSWNCRKLIPSTYA